MRHPSDPSCWHSSAITSSAQIFVLPFSSSITAPIALDAFEGKLDLRHFLAASMEPLQAVTRRFPAPLRDLLTSVLGHECYTHLVWDVDFEPSCLRLALSKTLGVSIVAGSALLKVPQLAKIVSDRSARGLSLAGYLLDSASLVIVVAYNLRLRFPFSTYGENVFLLAQNIGIIIAILTFTRQRRLVIPFAAVSVGATAALSTDVVALPLLRTLLSLSIPLSLSSKVPQIVANHRARSTGQLSAVLVFVSLAGCLARVFTTQTETGDRVLWWSFALTAVLNGVLAVQMGLYWNQSPERSTPEPVKVSVPDNIQMQQHQQTRQRTPSPLPKTSPTPQRWTRKVD